MSTYVVNATSNTTYANPDGTATSASALKVGTCISIWSAPSQYGQIVAEGIRIYSDGAGACS